MILNRPTRRLRNPASSSHSKARAVAANSPLSFEGMAVYRVMPEPYTSPIDEHGREDAACHLGPWPADGHAVRGAGLREHRSLNRDGRREHHGGRYQRHEHVVGRADRRRRARNGSRELAAGASDGALRTSASPCGWAGWRSSESRRPGHGLDGRARLRRGQHDPGVWGFTVVNALGALLVLGPLAATLLRRPALASLSTPQT